MLSRTRSTTPSSSEAVAAPTAVKARSVLLIDDEELLLKALRRSMRMERPAWEVTIAGSGEEGLRLIAERTFDAVISDMSMPGLHGISVLESIRDTRPEITRIALTGFVDEQWKVKNNSAAQIFFAKPCLVTELICAIEHPAQYFSSIPARSVTLPSSEVRRRNSPRSKRTLDWDDESEVRFS